VLRTVSNYDRQALGVSAAESLKQMVEGDYIAYRESLEAAERLGDRVVRDLVEDWPERESMIPSPRPSE
jgi:purine nucleoside permease